ncbi:MAG: ATP-dependent DNA helicase RecG [Rhodospirillaceae bacterium]|nr:ATP-dependent DNA helicase RecG [Rhodospirillaceae bacterium]
MRPEILYPLFRPVTDLKGVGPRIGNLIEKVAGANLAHLLWHVPSGMIDRRYAPKIVDATPGVIATITVQVDQHRKPPNRRMPYKILCSDETGSLTLVFFHAHEDYLRKTLPEGETRVVSGQLEQFGSDLQITHPDHICTPEEIETLKKVEPVYPLTAGLTLKALGRAINATLVDVPELPEWADQSFVTKQHWPRWHEAVLQAHAPENARDLEPTTTARARLAYDELLSNQVALAVIRKHLRRAKGRPVSGSGALRQRVLKTLPFQLTPSQTVAIDEILADMGSDVRMLRLLQGDVGSGKTMVAVMAMLNAVECGAQSVLMAPTEILARQHLATIEPLAKAAGVRTVLLTGRERGKNRTSVLEALESGAAGFAVGTHALFQDDVGYKNLALAVIDEQHRFGVHQRLALAAKGQAVDTLVMTATPIPRTLMLTAYGDMEVSRLTEKPAGRTPIDTRILPIERLGQVTEAVGRALNDGAKVYWVCPLVEESEKLDVAAVEDRHAHLAEVFGDRVGLVHGRMKGPAKDKVMAEFINGGVDILVATTVIEVGVDVAAASVMVVEHAERFGLAQLHQLRGRIGRGAAASTCLLLYAQPLSEMARARLTIMRETDDGFKIAEEDLRLRGAGELLGTRQSGMPEFKLADLQVHAELLAAARDDATLLLSRDPELTSERGQAVRTLLYLFERETAVRNLRSG